MSLCRGTCTARPLAQSSVFKSSDLRLQLYCHWMLSSFLVLKQLFLKAINRLLLKLLLLLEQYHSQFLTLFSFTLHLSLYSLSLYCSAGVYIPQRGQPIYLFPLSSNSHLLSPFIFHPFIFCVNAFLGVPLIYLSKKSTGGHFFWLQNKIYIYIYEFYNKKWKK